MGDKENKKLDFNEVEATESEPEEIIAKDENSKDTSEQLTEEKATEIDVETAEEKVPADDEPEEELEDYEESDEEVLEDDDEMEDAIESEEEIDLDEWSDSEDEMHLYNEDDFEDRIEEPEEHGENKALKEAEIAWEKSKKRKKIAKIFLVILLVLAAIYCGVALFFSSHFLPFTKINGNDFSVQTVEQVEAYLKQQVDDYSLTLLESDGDQEVIEGSEIDLEYAPSDDVKKVMDSQNEWLWITSLWNHTDIEAPVGVEFDEQKLSKKMETLKCVTDEQIPSISAHPEFKDTKFEIVEEQIGTELDQEVFEDAVALAIGEFKPELDMMEEGCYILPKFLKDSPEVKEAAEKMNSYLGANVTLDFNPYTEVVDAAQISEWVVVDDNMQVTFDQELVRAYVASLAEKYDTYGKTRSFVTGFGNTVEVQGGSYGWLLDQEAEYAALTANIQNAETVTREPNYIRRGASHEGNDFGNTYVEVDLTNQHIFFFQNGQCTMQSDIVTGNPNLGNGTPQGVYTIAYKQMNTVLRGPKKEDGTYEWESPVTYWMPFNGGIGLHDAPWRSSFGGTIYNGGGSHGCVNLPPAFAAQLYPVVDAGTPVVCHY